MLVKIILLLCLMISGDYKLLANAGARYTPSRYYKPTTTTYKPTYYKPTTSYKPSYYKPSTTYTYVYYTKPTTTTYVYYTKPTTYVYYKPTTYTYVYTRPTTYTYVYYTRPTTYVYVAPSTYSYGGSYYYQNPVKRAFKSVVRELLHSKFSPIALLNYYVNNNLRPKRYENTNNSTAY